MGPGHLFRGVSLWFGWGEEGRRTSPGNPEVIARAWHAKLVCKSRVNRGKDITEEEEGGEKEIRWQHPAGGKVGEGEKERVRNRIQI